MLFKELLKELKNNQLLCMSQNQCLLNGLLEQNRNVSTPVFQIEEKHWVVSVLRFTVASTFVHHGTRKFIVLAQEKLLLLILMTGDELLLIMEKEFHQNIFIWIKYSWKQAMMYKQVMFLVLRV